MLTSSRAVTVLIVMSLAGPVAACGSGSDSASAAARTATFSAPAPGARVSGGVELTLAARGVTIEPAGAVHADAGHLHVLADTGCADAGAAIPSDADHLHLGKGQLEGTIYLGPGTHELCVQVGDGEHHALDISDTITVDVGIDDVDQWCAAIREVDDLFEVTDNSDGEITAKHTGYENIHRLLAQIGARTDLVEPTQRANVESAIGAASTIAQVLSTATTQEEIDAQLSGIFQAEEDPFEPAAKWILDTCDVSITD